MSGEIVNLRQARKARKKAEAEAQAAENRIRFGRTKAERKAARSEADLAGRRLEGHRRDRPEGDETP
jgi:hypothetical protein